MTRRNLALIALNVLLFVLLILLWAASGGPGRL